MTPKCVEISPPQSWWKFEKVFHANKHESIKKVKTQFSRGEGNSVDFFPNTQKLMLGWQMKISISRCCCGNLVSRKMYVGGFFYVYSTFKRGGVDVCFSFFFLHSFHISINPKPQHLPPPCLCNDDDKATLKTLKKKRVYS